MILFVNACVRGESRTRRLADALLDRLGGEMEEVRLHEIDFPVVDEAFLPERNRLIAQEKWEHPMFELARQFAAADQVVIAAPTGICPFPQRSSNILSK